MDYIKVTFNNKPEQTDLLIALLADDFESFEETESGLNAFVPSASFSEQKVKEVIDQLKDTGNILYDQTLIKDRNWNALWESNFEPVLIGDQVYVRAPFHQEKIDIKYEIVIEPKMSFGTGHHSTTSLVMEEMLKMDMNGKSVLDMGCGSAILAILSSKMGAKNILAIDTDDWAFQNAMENCERNHSQHIVVQKGDSTLIRGKTFDVILANINRNVLLSDMNEYVAALRSSGHLLISGFIDSDKEMMIRAGEKFGLKTKSYEGKNQWMMIHFQK
jgi:ribosomal protein L11 methyltransferase